MFPVPRKKDGRIDWPWVIFNQISAFLMVVAIGHFFPSEKRDAQTRMAKDHYPPPSVWRERRL